MRPMRFAEFARKLPSVFDALAKQGEDIIVEKEGRFFHIVSTGNDSESETTSNYSESEKSQKLKEQLEETLKRWHETEAVWVGYNPEKMQQGLQQSAGALKGVDRAALQRDIKRQRQQERHGRPT